VKIAWTVRAVERLDAIRAHVSLENPAAAQRLARRIVERADLLALQPGMGHAGREPGTLEHVVSGTAYILVYEVRDETVSVLSVVHGRNRP
jgi:plasmid stabilization system protein ParE